MAKSESDERRRSAGERLTGLELGLLQASKPGYLGNKENVALALAPFIQAVVSKKQALFTGGDFKAAVELVREETDRATKIFCGENPDFAPLPSWNSEAELGKEVIHCFDLDPEWYGDENLYCIISEGLTGVALAIDELIDDGLKPVLAGVEGDFDSLQRGLIELFDFVVCVFWGTRTLFYADVTLNDFTP